MRGDQLIVYCSPVQGLKVLGPAGTTSVTLLRDIAPWKLLLYLLRMSVCVRVFVCVCVCVCVCVRTCVYLPGSSSSGSG